MTLASVTYLRTIEITCTDGNTNPEAHLSVQTDVTGLPNDQVVSSTQRYIVNVTSPDYTGIPISDTEQSAVTAALTAATALLPVNIAS